MAKTSESGVWDQDPPGSGRTGSAFVKRTLNVKLATKAEVVRDDWDDDDDDDDDDDEEEVGDVGGEKDRKNLVAQASQTQHDGVCPGPGPSGTRETETAARKGAEESSQVWEAANKRAPMPELIVARASTSQSVPPPPPAAFQPTLRILKRPSPNPNGNDVGTLSSVSHSSTSPGHSSSSGAGSGGTSPAPRGTLAEREAQYQEARSRIFGEKAKSGSTNASSASISRTGSSSGAVVVVRDPLGPSSEPDLADKVHGGGRLAKGFGERGRGKK